MEIRRVQMTGGASFVISLPKDWATSQGLKKNDSLGIVIQPDGNLLITKNIHGKYSQREIEIKVDRICDESFLLRCLIAAYVDGYSIINLSSKTGFKPFVREGVRTFLRMTIGLEVIEETANQILMKDLVDSSEMPFDKSIRRMHVMINTMHRNAIQVLKDRDTETADDINRMDADVDRLNWLIARQYNRAMRDAKTAERIGVTTSIATMYYLTSRILERIADHAVIIANNAKEIANKKIDKRILDSIDQTSIMAIGIFNDSMESMFKKDIQRSNDAIRSVPELVRKCNALTHSIVNLNAQNATSLGYIVESIRRTGEYSRNISECVINTFVGEMEIIM